jgi:putative flippase GtrA
MTDTPILSPALREKVMREGQMFIKFGVVGAGLFLVDVSLTLLIMDAGFSYLVGRAVGILVAMHCGFVLNRLWAFKAMREYSLFRQWIGYVAANGMGAVVSYSVGWVLLQPGMIFQHIPFLAAACGTASGMVINFAGSRILAFRR